MSGVAFKLNFPSSNCSQSHRAALSGKWLDLTHDVRWCLDVSVALRMPPVCASVALSDWLILILWPSSGVTRIGAGLG